MILFGFGLLAAGFGVGFAYAAHLASRERRQREIREWLMLAYPPIPHQPAPSPAPPARQPTFHDLICDCVLKTNESVFVVPHPTRPIAVRQGVSGGRA